MLYLIKNSLLSYSSSLYLFYAWRFLTSHSQLRLSFTFNAVQSRSFQQNTGSKHHSSETNRKKRTQTETAKRTSSSFCCFTQCALAHNSDVCVSVEQIGDFCNPNPVQNFHWVIRSDPNPVDLSKYLIQSGLYQKNTTGKHFTAVINAVWISISDLVKFFRNPVRSWSGS